MNRDETGRARPPGAPRRPQRKKLPHERPRWLRPEDEVFFITVCCVSRGKNQLCHQKIAREIFDSAQFRNQNAIWYAHLVCLMPDHLHLLISFPYERPMKAIVADWKRFLATKLKIEWQRDFFDHRLRKDESYQEKADYVRANPVRAGLVAPSEDWPYFWQADPQTKDGIRERRALRGGAPGGRALPMLLAVVLLIVACRPDMANQPKAKPLSESDFFSNQANARPIPPHTVERGGARENAAFYTGLTNGTYITRLPVNLTPKLLARGRECFDAMCAECHDRTGSGNGMVVLRGFPQPPSYHVPRLRNAPIGHFYDVITNGYGVMYSYATRVEPEDRWAIAAYIRALQLSHNVNASELTPAEQQKLATGRAPPTGGLKNAQ
ncbi:MAG TPA: c-type cytochrome [Candidatus Udaeobacter sp.]|jgi:REP element-mobilizing transposase RayT/mono/diheme cytochrome c family protein